MNYQIRIRVDESFSRIDYIQDWLNEAQHGFAFEHNIPGNRHYHIYLFGFTRNADAMRRHLGKHIPEKERYAVGSTCGGKKKIKITPEGAYQYGTTKNRNTPIWTKGFTPTELEEYEKVAEKYYRPLPIVVGPEDHLPEREVIFKVDRVWERLRDSRDKYKDLTLPKIKSKIAVDYLNSGKAVPRPSDLHRYAISIYYLNKYDDKGYLEDDALECEYNKM